MNQALFNAWKEYVPDLAEVLKKMDETSIIAVGVAPYPRIMPSLFLDNYSVYSVKDAADIDLLRRYATIFCLEERNPEVAKKVHATGYLLRNYMFRGFLNSRKGPFKLLFYQTTVKIVETLKEFNIGWIGNEPETFLSVVLKGDFRDLVKQRGLPSIPDWRVPRDTFLAAPFEELWGHWNRPFVVQRADFDVAGEMGTFFINNESDLDICRNILKDDVRYTMLTISPFLTGNSLSMLGCVTEKGILSSTLQLQMIDVPESLHGQLPTGVFLGHDWAFREWSEETELTAQKAVESIGAYLAEKGFKGIFGIDFLYDTTTKEIFPIECNPRFTGALPVYSLMVAANGVPTIEFFHLLTHLGIHSDFDFNKVNAGFKKRKPLAHIALTPKGILEMKHDLKSGIYSYHIQDGQVQVQYEREGAFYWDFKNKNEFILIDSLPRKGGRIIQNVPRLCKLIFPHGIAKSTKEVIPEVGMILTALSTEFRIGQTPSELPSEYHVEE
jgi:predicted ATP-grasp superfamily ATP-dependent carboligase